MMFRRSSTALPRLGMHHTPPPKGRSCHRMAPSELVSHARPRFTPPSRGVPRGPPLTGWDHQHVISDAPVGHARVMCRTRSLPVPSFSCHLPTRTPSRPRVCYESSDSLHRAPRSRKSTDTRSLPIRPVAFLIDRPPKLASSCAQKGTCVDEKYRPRHTLPTSDLACRGGRPCSWRRSP